MLASLTSPMLLALRLVRRLAGASISLSSVQAQHAFALPHSTFRFITCIFGGLFITDLVRLKVKVK